MLINSGPITLVSSVFSQSEGLLRICWSDSLTRMAVAPSSTET